VSDISHSTHPELRRIGAERTAMNDASTPDTIVLIHGLWMTPLCWEQWVPYYESKGYRVVTPTYPGFDIGVEGLRENPEVIAQLTVPQTVDHLATEIEKLGKPPIIMGHSFGGTLTQLLVARGLGAAAVAINSAPTEGVRVSPPSQLKSFFPILSHPSTFHGAFGYTAEQFHYTFTNTLSREDSDKVYTRYHRTRQLGLGVRTDRQLQAGAPGNLGRLLPGCTCAAPVHCGRGRPHHARVSEPVERRPLLQ
jgi:pimeloyl-ACP methyl ester carboxylesterase